MTRDCMKYLLIGLASFLGLLPQVAFGVTIDSEEIHLHINTDKVAIIDRPIYEKQRVDFIKQMHATENLPGARVILINSPGGSVDEGEKMLTAIRVEKAQGTQIVCVVVNAAHSMAFNILSNCDIRLSQPKAMMLVHKIRFGGCPPVPLTGRNFRKWADELDKADEPYRQTNSRVMHLTLDEYDEAADKETMWLARTLKDMGYLHGFATIKK